MWAFHLVTLVTRSARSPAGTLHAALAGRSGRTLRAPDGRCACHTRSAGGSLLCVARGVFRLSHGEDSSRRSCEFAAANRFRPGIAEHRTLYACQGGRPRRQPHRTAATCRSFAVAGVSVISQIRLKCRGDDGFGDCGDRCAQRRRARLLPSPIPELFCHIWFSTRIIPKPHDRESIFSMEIPKDAGREEIVGGQRVGDGDPRGAGSPPASSTGSSARGRSARCR